jgi:hypothetical protein
MADDADDAAHGINPSSPSRLSVATEKGLFVSSDNGATFKKAMSALADEDIEAVAVAPDGRAFAGSFRGVFVHGEDIAQSGQGRPAAASSPPRCHSTHSLARWSVLGVRSGSCLARIPWGPRAEEARSGPHGSPRSSHPSSAKP